MDACKTLLFMAAVGAVRTVWAVWAVRAVRAVRAVGVGHGLEPCFFCMAGALKEGENIAFHGRALEGGRGASASGGGGEGVVGIAFHGRGAAVRCGRCGRWVAGTGACKTLLFMAGALRWGR